MANEEKLFNLNFNLLMALSFLLFITSSSLMFLIPLHIIDIGGGEAMVGLAAGLTMIIGVVTRPLSGAYIDLHGCKKIILMGTILFCSSTFLFIFADTVTMVIILRAFQGLAWGGMLSALFTLAAKLAPLKRQGEAMGYFAIAPPAANAIGPLTADYISSTFNYTITIIFISVIVLITFVLTILIKEKNSEIVKKEDKQGGRPPLLAKSVILPSIMGLVVAFSYGAIMTFMPILGKVREISNVGFFFSLYGMVLVVTRPFAGKTVDRLGYFYTIGSSLVFVILAMAVIAFANTLNLLLVGAVLFGFGMTVSYPSLMKLTVEMSSEEERGRAMATFTAAMDVGAGIGVMGLGYLLSKTSMTSLYLTCAIILFTNLLYVLFPGRSRLTSIGAAPDLSQSSASGE